MESVSIMSDKSDEYSSWKSFALELETLGNRTLQPRLSCFSTGRRVSPLTRGNRLSRWLSTEDLQEHERRRE